MWTSSGKVYSFIIHNFLIFATLQFIPPVQCANNGNYDDWDLAVAHENRVMVVSRERSDTSVDLAIQMPKNDAEAFAATANSRRIKPRIEYLATDPNRGLIFFSHVFGTQTSVAVFNFQDNSTHILVQNKNMNGSISGLAYHQNFLYWSDGANKNIMRLNTTAYPALLPPPEQILSPRNESIYGLAIHPPTGRLFWASWSSDFTASKIYSFDAATQLMEVAVSGLTQPDSVVADKDFLYWIDDTEGIDFHIERVRLPHFDQREVLHRGQHQNPTSLTILSHSKLFWTDIVGKSVHELDLQTKSVATVKQFKRDRVYGVASFGNDAPLSPNSSANVKNNHEKIKQVPVIGNSSEEKVTDASLSPNSSSDVKKSNVHVLQNSSKEKTAGAAVLGNSSSNEKLNETSSGVLENDSSDVQKGSVLNAPSNINKSDNNRKNSSSEPLEDRMEWCGDWESIPCLNGASCLSVNRKIFCLCVPGFSGPTCEDRYEVGEKSRDFLSGGAEIALGSCLIGAVVILTMVILYLALKVKKLNRKPKIHKKIVVAKSRRGDRNSSSVCEMIDIENCCNMNVCETPCYDPIGPTTSSKSSRSSRKKYGKDDDNERLIDS